VCAGLGERSSFQRLELFSLGNLEINSQVRLSFFVCIGQRTVLESRGFSIGNAVLDRRIAARMSHIAMIFDELIAVLGDAA
jgi:hypothetical protein